MFGAIEQRLNEQADQMAQFKIEQAVDKADLKRKQTALMADIRVMSRFEFRIQLSHWLSMLTKRRNQLNSAVIKQDFIVFNQY